MKHFSRHLIAVCLAFSLCLSCVSPPKQAKAFVDPVTALSVASLVVTSYFFVTGLIARLQDPSSSQDFSEAVVQLIKDTAGDEGIWGRDPETSEPWLYDSLLNHIQRNTTVGGAGLLVTTNWLAGCLSRLGTYLVDDLGVNKDSPVDLVQLGSSGGNVPISGSIPFMNYFPSSAVKSSDFFWNYAAPVDNYIGVVSSVPQTDSLPIVGVLDETGAFIRAASYHLKYSIYDQWGFRFGVYESGGTLRIEGLFTASGTNFSSPPVWYLLMSGETLADQYEAVGAYTGYIADGASYWASNMRTFGSWKPLGIIKALFNKEPYEISEPQKGNVLTMQEEEYMPVGALLNTQGVAIQTPSDSDDIDDIYAAVIGGAAAGVLEPSDFAAEKADSPIVDLPEDLTLWDYLKGIWQSILDIPANLAEMLKRLCIPSEEYLAEFPSMILNRFGAQTGILTYPLAKTMEIISHLTAANISDPVFSWGDIREPFTGEVCFPAGSYNFSSMTENSVMSAALTTAKVLQGGGVIFLFMRYLHRKWCYLFGDDLDET